MSVTKSDLDPAQTPHASPGSPVGWDVTQACPAPMPGSCCPSPARGPPSPPVLLRSVTEPGDLHFVRQKGLLLLGIFLCLTLFRLLFFFYIAVLVKRRRVPSATALTKVLNSGFCGFYCLCQTYQPDVVGGRLRPAPARPRGPSCFPGPLTLTRSDGKNHPECRGPSVLRESTDHIQCLE